MRPTVKPSYEIYGLQRFMEYILLSIFNDNSVIRSHLLHILVTMDRMVIGKSPPDAHHSSGSEPLAVFRPEIDPD